MKALPEESGGRSSSVTSLHSPLTPLGAFIRRDKSFCAPAQARGTLPSDVARRQVARFRFSPTGLVRWMYLEWIASGWQGLVLLHHPSPHAVHQTFHEKPVY